jgi:protein phosphatase
MRLNPLGRRRPRSCPDAGSRFRWTSRSHSHVGLVRAVNEDACLDRPERGVWAVADGMGGHSVGDFASRMVVEALSNVPPLSSLESFVTDTRARLQAVNRDLRAEVKHRDVAVIGSTVAVLLACGRRCGFLWAGDSRIYLYRDGRLRLLTRDHNRLEELKARGLVTAEEAADHPARFRVTRAVGVLAALDLDEGAVEAHDGDVFLLCSDGLNSEVSEREIAGALLSGNCQQATGKLIDLALARGGRDNISAVVVRAEDLDSGDRTLFNPAL